MPKHPATPFERTHSPVALRPRETVSALVAGVAALSLYLFTLAPTVTFGDSGELITAAVTLGVAHPPGYPLWLILAKMFSFLPLGDIAFRLNLMSAIFGAAAVGILALIIVRTLPLVCFRILSNEYFHNPGTGIILGTASVAASLCLAFSPTFWQQSLIAEVYALNNLLICLILLVLALWIEAPWKKGWLFAAAFLFGMGQANHQTLLLLAPAIVLLVLLRRPLIIISARAMLGCVGFFLLGLALYLYLPIRASANPPINWGDPETWNAFRFHVFRKQYRSIELVRPVAVILPQLKFFFRSAVSESLSVLFVAPAALVAGFSRREGRIWLVFTGVAFLCVGVALVVIANTELDLNAQDLLRIYFLPSWIFLAIWCGYGMGILGLMAAKALRRVQHPLATAALVVFPLLALPLWTAVVNYDKASMRGHEFALFYGESLMNSMREGAILFAGTDSAYSIPMYLKWVNGERRDVSILSVNRLANQNYAAEASRNAPDIEFLSPNDYAEAFSLYGLAGIEGGGVYGAHRTMNINAYLLLKLFQRNRPGKPMYYDEGLPIDWIHDFAVPAGLVMEVKRERLETLPDEAVQFDIDYWNSLEARLLSDKRFVRDSAAQQKFSKCRSNIGGLYFHRKMFHEAEAALKQAIRLSNRNIEAYSLLALLYVEQGDRGRAVAIFDEYLRRDKWNTSAGAFAQALRQ